MALIALLLCTCFELGGKKVVPSCCTSRCGCCTDEALAPRQKKYDGVYEAHRLCKFRAFTWVVWNTYQEPGFVCLLHAINACAESCIVQAATYSD